MHHHVPHLCRRQNLPALGGPRSGPHTCRQTKPSTLLTYDRHIPGPQTCYLHKPCFSYTVPPDLHKPSPPKCSDALRKRYTSRLHGGANRNQPQDGKQRRSTYDTHSRPPEKCHKKPCFSTQALPTTQTTLQKARLFLHKPSPYSNCYIKPCFFKTSPPPVQRCSSQVPLVIHISACVGPPSRSSTLLHWQWPRPPQQAAKLHTMPVTLILLPTNQSKALISYTHIHPQSVRKSVAFPTQALPPEKHMLRKARLFVHKPCPKSECYKQPGFFYTHHPPRKPCYEKPGFTQTLPPEKHMLRKALLFVHKPCPQS